MSRLVRIALAAIVAVAALTPDLAWADARTKARRAFREGMRLIAAESYKDGIALLEEANATLPHPNVQYNIAQAYVTVEQPEAALFWFRTYLAQPKPPRDADRIEALIDELEQQLRARQRRAALAPSNDLPEGDTDALSRSTTDDLARLDELAEAMRPLATDRAAELDAITKRMRRALESGVRAPPAPPPKRIEFIETKPVFEDELRVVEEYQERQVVTAATRNAADPEDAPAVVWVITQEQIRRRGYESVAEALRAVAGLHVIDDHVFIDVGVRGLHGGLRGMSRIIKVLIDGHPVAFRPTNGTLLGVELIPIRAVDRIELVRGPGSALYGANAFLGVLQIVTRQGGDVGGGAVTGRIGFSTSTERVDGTLAPNASGSVDGVVGTREGNLSVLAAAQVSVLDRSGLRIPKTSPYVEELTEFTGGVSNNDRATPLSLFGSLEYDMGKKGRLSLTMGWQRLEAAAEWLDYGALTNFSKVQLSNFWARLAYDLQVSDDAGFRAFTSYARAGPIGDHQIRPLSGFSLRPDTARYLVEDYESHAVLSGLELRWDLPKHRVGVRIGTDLDVDVQQLASVSEVFAEDVGVNPAGSTIRVASSLVPERTFTNVGLYLQVVANPFDAIDVIGGLRYDFHSIYASALNGRVGAVFRASERFYFKVLYGSSFRAPAPDQLYRGAAYTGDAVGCIDYAPCAAVGLDPQTAHTGELVAGVVIDERLSAQITGYISFVNNLIFSFPNYANAFVTTNVGRYSSRGLEVEGKAKLRGIATNLDLEAHIFFQVQGTDDSVSESLFEPAESIRAEFRAASLFPNVSGGAGLDLAYLPAKLGLYIEGRYVGPRRASGSNLALALGLSAYDGENLPGYVEIDANLSTRDLYIFERGETVLSLRVTDIIGTRHAEGGYRGWDIPTIGRLVFFRITQEY